MLRVSRFRENNISFLDMPPENDLHIGLSILSRQFGKNLLIDQSGVAMPDRIPRLEDCAIRRKPLFQCVLLVVGVALHLKNGRLDRCRFAYFLQTLGFKIRKTDCTHLSLCNCLLHIFPRAHIITHLLMEQKQICSCQVRNKKFLIFFIVIF